MSDLKQLIVSLGELDVKDLALDKKAQTFSVLQAILKACRERDLSELNRQAERFISLTYDPANVVLGYTPESPSPPLELFNEIENRTLAVLEKIAASGSDARN